MIWRRLSPKPAPLPSQELASALCTLRLLSVHFLLLHRARIDASTMLMPPPPAETSADAGENRLEQLRASFVERLFKVLLVPLTDVQPDLRALWSSIQVASPPRPVLL